MDHEFIMLEKYEIVPMLSKLKKAQGKERGALVREWIQCLLEDAPYYIPELQSMGYEIRNQKDLINMARELDYYQVAPGSFLVK